MRLAQLQGVEQITMRALAAELGTSPAALYYHVPNKAGILDLVAEAVLATIDIPDANSGSWEQRLRQIYIHGRKALLPINGIATVLQSRPLAASGEVLDAASMSILLSAGVSPSSARAAHALLFTHLLGSVILAHSGTRSASEETFVYGLDVIIAGLRDKEGLV